MKTRYLLVALLFSTLFLPKKSDAAIISILNFQAGGILALQNGGDSLSAQVAWTPLVDLGLFGVRGDLGATLFKNQLGNSFVATNMEALLSLPLLPKMMDIEGGGGLQTWHDGNGGTHPSLSINLVVKLLAGLDRIYVGYSRFFADPGVNIFRAGIGFEI